MRSIAVVTALAACAPTTAIRPSEPRHVSCGGIRIALPRSLLVLRVTPTELIAASPDLALIVTTDEPEPARRSVSGFLIDQVSDSDHPGYMQAYRRVDRCTLHAVATRAAGLAGDRLLADVAGAEPEHWMIGSPRIPIEPALAVALRALDAVRE